MTLLKADLAYINKQEEVETNEVKAGKATQRRRLNLAVGRGRGRHGALTGQEPLLSLRLSLAPKEASFL